MSAQAHQRPQGGPPGTGLHAVTVTLESPASVSMVNVAEFGPACIGPGSTLTSMSTLLPGVRMPRKGSTKIQPAPPRLTLTSKPMSSPQSLSEISNSSVSGWFTDPKSRLLGETCTSQDGGSTSTKIGMSKLPMAVAISTSSEYVPGESESRSISTVRLAAPPGCSVPPVGLTSIQSSLPPVRKVTGPPQSFSDSVSGSEVRSSPKSSALSERSATHGMGVKVAVGGIGVKVAVGGIGVIVGVKVGVAGAASSSFSSSSSSSAARLS